jgi:hypothetical protein
MFNNISWQSYWTSIALMATIYYLVVFFIYFKADFIASFSLKGWPISSRETKGFTSPVESDGSFLEEKDRTEEFLVYACIDEIKALYEQLKSSKGVKQEIVYALQQVLNKYPTLKNSPYKRSINHVIVSQSEHICSIRLSSEDVDHVWIG